MQNNATVRQYSSSWCSEDLLICRIRWQSCVQQWLTCPSAMLSSMISSSLRETVTSVLTQTQSLDRFVYHVRLCLSSRGSPNTDPNDLSIPDWLWYYSSFEFSNVWETFFRIMIFTTRPEMEPSHQQFWSVSEDLILIFWIRRLC